jgi:hypothetical protein
MSSGMQVVLVPYPVFVGASLYRRLGPQLTREPKTGSQWPIRQAIPDKRAIDDLLTKTRREIADRRAQRLMRELERAS